MTVAAGARVLAVADPTAGEWVALGAAFGFVLLLGGLLVVWPVLRGSPATAWGRAAGLLLGALTVELLVVAAIVVVAGEGDVEQAAATALRPSARTAQEVRGHVVALALPAAAVLLVLAHAVVAVGRPSGLRAVAGGAAGALAAVGCTVALGDTGTAPTVAGVAAAALAGGAALALAADEVAALRAARRAAGAGPAGERPLR